MNGAIFYSGMRGSTAQYAHWIGEATGLPVFDANNPQADPSDFDFLILASSVIFMTFCGSMPTRLTMLSRTVTEFSALNKKTQKLSALDVMRLESRAN
jgi:hypothetical protein